MNYQKIPLEVPPLSDEGAAALKCFINQLMHAVDEHYYKQVHRYHLNSLLREATLVDSKEELTDPPF